MFMGMERNLNCKVSWIVKRYVDRFRINPTMPIESFMKTVQEERNVEIYIQHTYRAKAQITKIIDGTNKEEYTRL
ncbi:hypothetical protein CerSpe_159150 [Prunus speciosa]